MTQKKFFLHHEKKNVNESQLIFWNNNIILDLIFFECNIYKILLIGTETNLEHSKTIHSSETLYLVISSFCTSNFNVILHKICFLYLLSIVFVLLHFDDVGMLLLKHVLIMLLIIFMIIKTFTYFLSKTLHLPIFLKR